MLTNSDIESIDLKLSRKESVDLQEFYRQGGDDKLLKSLNGKGITVESYAERLFPLYDNPIERLNVASVLLSRGVPVLAVPQAIIRHPAGRGTLEENEDMKVKSTNAGIFTFIIFPSETLIVKDIWS